MPESTHAPSRSTVISVAWAAPSVVCTCLAAWGARVHAGAIPFVGLWVLWNAVYLGAVWSAHRMRLTVVLLAAVLSRLILLPSPLWLEDDIYRYLWDGKVLAHGINPYVYTPDALDTAELRDETWLRVRYKSVRTIYPPLAEAVFGTATKIGLGTPTALKAVFLIFDLANLGLLLLLLRQLGLPATGVLVYAWSPLVLKEFANSGHMDVMMLTAVLTAALLFLQHRHDGAAVALAAAVLLKLSPLLLAPLYFGRRVRSYVIFAAAVAAGYLPFHHAGLLLFSGLRIYGERWRFNGSTYPLVEHFSPHAAALGCSLLLATGCLCLARYGRRGDREFIRANMAIPLLLLLMAPTTDPWYVTWLVPWLCVEVWLAPLAMAVGVGLSYIFFIAETQWLWVRLSEYLPVAALLLTDAVRRRPIALEPRPGD